MKNLSGVHPDLVAVILRASEGGVPFVVTEGLRSPDRQEMLVAAGKSRTLNSRHLHGLAVDLAVKTAAGVSWVRDDYKMLAMTIRAAAVELGIPVLWGGEFVGFFDGCHWELQRSYYPDPPLDFSDRKGVTTT
ncbi:MAG: M15 family metallopeptidase [Deltaproteobacteria bacterium]